ncbi:MAG: Na+/H+ antiporter NhaA, partial [Acidimicrobiia bacterium]
MPLRATRPVLIRPLRDFLATESAGGIALVGAALLALLWANSPWQESYRQLWETVIDLRLGSLSLTLDLRQFVNEALMTIFFLVVGLEIKREIVEGELRDASRRALPVFAAIGGMIIPALIYAGINFGMPEVRGWGIPMATDIALAVGVMTLAGNVRPALKIFLLALAIVDDIGAILVIGVFYAGHIELGWIGAGCVAVALVVVLQKRRVDVLWVYVTVGSGLWLALHEAGIHATLTGVILGFLAPTKPYLSKELIDDSELTKLDSARDAEITTRLARSAVSVVEWLEHRLHPWTSFLVVPIFAFANAGISLSAESL